MGYHNDTLREAVFISKLVSTPGVCAGMILIIFPSSLGVLLAVFMALCLLIGLWKSVQLRLSKSGEYRATGIARIKHVYFFQGCIYILMIQTAYFKKAMFISLFSGSPKETMTVLLVMFVLRQ